MKSYEVGPLFSRMVLMMMMEEMRMKLTKRTICQM